MRLSNSFKGKSMVQAGLLALLLSASASAFAGGKNISKVLGGISIEQNANAGDLESVNGGIKLGDGATAENVSAVNGSIKLGSNVSIKSAESVNGKVIAEEGLKATGSLSTVNGRIVIKANSSVGGSLETVNGDIDITGTSVEGNLSTVNGDFRLTASKVGGDLVIEKNKRWFGKDKNIPTITIDDKSEVSGDIHLHRPVNLEISPKAKIGKIIKHYED